MAVGSNGTIITSSDGITWTTRTSNSTENLTTLIRASNQYIAVSDTGKILYSK
jgi:flagellin